MEPLTSQPFLAWTGAAQVPHSSDNARDMTLPAGSSLLLDSLPVFSPVKSSGHSTAPLPVQPLQERG